MSLYSNRTDKENRWMEIELAILLIVLVASFGIKICYPTYEEKTEAKCVVKEQQEKCDEEMTIVGKSEREVIADGQYPIMGHSDITVDQLVKYFQKSGKPYPKDVLGKGGASSIEVFSTIYIEEANAEGVRVEVAFAQTMKETGFLQYGGDASPKQYNFAGLGTIGNGVPGNSFPDVRTGVRAQIQHLKAYATTDALNQACVDERYEYVKKGSSPYVEWLGKNENPEGQGWATADKYGYSIVEMIHKLKE